MQESSLAKIPQVDVKLELDDTPTCEEIKKATVLDELQDLFTNCCEKGTLPQDLRDAVIVSL